MKKYIKSLLHYIDITGVCIKQELLILTEYPAAILGWLISNLIQFIVGFATIQFVVREFGQINGWNFGQLAFLYGLSVITHALSMVLFIQGWFMGYYVIEGEFDRYLTRPLSVLYQFFFTHINIVGVTDLIPGLLVFVYGCYKVGFQWNLVNIITLLALIIGATLIRGGIYILFGTTSFFTRSFNNFGMYTQELFDKTTMYPISMYPESVQFVLTYLIPIGWVSFYPVSDMLGIKSTYAQFTGATGITLVVGIIVIIVAGLFFKLGLKKYESAGN